MMFKSIVKQWNVAILSACLAMVTSLPVSAFWIFNPPKPTVFVSDSVFGELETVRTPDTYFNNLKDFPYAPRYITVDGLRIHYVEEGPIDGDVILLLHGEPTWAYLYRHMISDLSKRGYRVIAPDLIGFGRSDKLVHEHDHTYERHVYWIKRFIEEKHLLDITLFVQDWGSYIGLRVAVENNHYFSRVFLSNGGLPRGDSTPAGFKAFKMFIDLFPHFPTAIVMQSGTLRILSKAELDAYTAPYPTQYYAAGPNIFDDLVPTDIYAPGAQENYEAWQVLDSWEKPFLTVFGWFDFVLGKLDREFIERIPGADGQPHKRVLASHFIQEDVPSLLSEELDNFVKNTK